MNDVPHQWILDKLTALCLMGEMDKEEVERIHALFVQRFPDEMAQMKQQLQRAGKEMDRAITKLNDGIYQENLAGLRKARHNWRKTLADLEQQGDNYITESACE